MTKEFLSIQEFGIWIKENPQMLATFPLMGDFNAAYLNLNRGCTCKRNAKLKTLQQIFFAMVQGLNNNTLAKEKFKKLADADKIIFNIQELSERKIEIE
tara:strand:- start:168 stop:464 length:297 start_codon:yes stop_codon:yes gene_type:complete